ncbi:MAG: endonuclease/exonuclease/phosphatase family protein [Mycobacteriales bacterium]|nr:endonuclease/exonuclease/phosphatase family protein [Mycobacteriales bacterium]
MRLATLNLLHGRSITDFACDPGRLRDSVTELDADVLGLQEVDRAQPRSDLRDLTAEVAEAGGAVAWRFVPALVGTPGEVWRAATDADLDETSASYGVGLVSRFPVLDWRVVTLPAAPVKSPIMLPGTRKWILLQDEPRIGLAAVVETPLGVMTIATTHLSFVPVWNGVQLRKLLAALADLPGPKVLLGDLNMPPPFPQLLSGGWRSLASAPTYPSNGPRIQLDHVLGHGNLPPVRRVSTPPLPVSDHRALAIDL